MKIKKISASLLVVGMFAVGTTAMADDTVKNDAIKITPCSLSVECITLKDGEMPNLPDGATKLNVEATELIASSVAVINEDEMADKTEDFVPMTKVVLNDTEASVCEPAMELTASMTEINEDELATKTEDFVPMTKVVLNDTDASVCEPAMELTASMTEISEDKIANVVQKAIIMNVAILANEI